MKRKISIAVIFVAGTVLGIGLPAIPAIAAAPAHQLAYNAGASSLCFNRSGQGTSIGTPVIAYNCGQPNNDFLAAQKTNMCGGGYVTPTCPFTVGSGLNDAYQGDPIVSLWAYKEGLCVGGPSSTDFVASLQPCPNSEGVGGGWSTIDIEAYSTFNNNHNYFVFINLHWSDRNYQGGSGCNGWNCSLVVSGWAGYRDPIHFNEVDLEVQQGVLASAAPYNQWADIGQG